MNTLKFSFPEELTIYEVAHIHNELNVYFESNDEVALDLSQIEELDSAGIQLIFKSLNQLSREGKRLVIFSVSDVVNKKFNILGLNLPNEMHEE
jgi:anti-anti-sigma factor